MNDFFTSRIAFFLLGALAGGAVASAILLEANLPSFMATPSPVAAASTTTSTSMPIQSTDVSVENQSAGNTVNVDSVTVPPPGVWVAVADLNSDGSLGNVLGASLVGGPRSNVVVDLLRSTLPAHQYAIVLYRDDDKGTFSISSDSVYVDFTTGQEVEVPFSTLPQ